MDEIELVVKIPKNTYRQIQALARNNYFEHDICGNSMRRIANGIPLPKWHGRLIDADKLLKTWYDDFCYDDFCEFMSRAELNSMNNVIKNAPTIIEADKN